jgi:diketogulonate reductase-like aldo/keto reductase
MTGTLPPLQVFLAWATRLSIVVIPRASTMAGTITITTPQVVCTTIMEIQSMLDRDNKDKTPGVQVG